jgi:protein-S-isoprenylcysteine O-methyltransferase Ste14
LLLLLAFCAVTAARSVWLRRTTGINPYVIDHREPLLRFVAQVFFAVIAGFVCYFSAIAIWPGAEEGLGLVAWVAGDGARWAGVLVMTLATLWTGVAQFSMGSSWRIGIPSRAPGLRTKGPFAISRNPIFLGMLLFAGGLTLWSPSAVTFVLLVASYLAIEVQIRAEEAFLEAAHGDAYRAYRARVRRWL